MKGLTKTQGGKGFLDLVEVEEPTTGDNEALIRINVAGICGTDLHIEEGRFNCIPPVVLGHEFCGRIEKVGKNVKDFAVGDRVVAEAHKGGCGTCRYCQRGEVEVCKNKKAIGYKIHGCFAPLVSLPETVLHHVPDNITDEQAALTEPLAIVMKALGERCRVEPEDFVVVLGCGPIGLLAAAAAKAEGASAVLITGTGRDEKIRLAAAKKMGIERTINIEKTNLAELVAQMTDGLGADLVVEASGAPPAIRQALEIVRTNGRVCCLGLTGGKTVEFPWDPALIKSIDLNFSASSNWTSWTRAISMLGNKKVNVDPLITQVLPIAEWETAFHMLRNLEAIKVLLKP